MPPLIGDIFQEIRKQLSPVSKELAAKDAEQIIEHVLNISRSEVHTNLKFSVTKEQHEDIIKIVHQRLTGMPLPYVLGYAYFYSKKISVSRDVIIPRPDTETLIEVILENETTDKCNFVDIGTGSGNITAILTGIRSEWRAVAVDISVPILKLARTNFTKRVYLLCNNKLSAVKGVPFFDFIVSNPPYISREEMDRLDSSVSNYEPAVGLYGGEDGLDFYRYLADTGKSFLKNNGHIYCEIGATQDKSVIKIFTDSGWTDSAIYNDLANRPRVVAVSR